MKNYATVQDYYRDRARAILIARESAARQHAINTLVSRLEREGKFQIVNHMDR